MGEEIVKALCKQKQFLLEEQERTGNTPDSQLVYITGEAVFEILDIIHRLQDDYSKLKERYVKVLDLNEKVIYEQKAEIERLKSFIDFKTANVMCDKCKQQAVKETAEKLRDKVHKKFEPYIQPNTLYSQKEKELFKVFLDKFDEICKEITEGKSCEG